MFRDEPWLEPHTRLSSADQIRFPIVRFTADCAGWAEVHFSDGDQVATAALSNVFPPMEEIAGWVASVAEKSPPLEVEIDEEGSIASLVALPSDDPELVLFLVINRPGKELRYRGLVNRQALAKAMATAILSSLNDSAQIGNWNEFFADDEAEGADPRAHIRSILDPLLR